MQTLSDPADAAVNGRLTKEEKIRFLREMFRIRRFEQTSLKHYNLGKIGVFFISTRTRKLSPSVRSRFWATTTT